MMVRLCDKCEKILRVNDIVVYGNIRKGKLHEDLGLDIQGIVDDMLQGEFFCSIECLKENIK